MASEAVMTSGDEPQLGGQDHDNAPMISGRGTKIIVDARGAYLAGNLKALIESMDETKRHLYRLALLSHELWWAEELIGYLRSSNLSSEVMQLLMTLERMLPLANEWLSLPTQDNAEAILSSSEPHTAINPYSR